MPNTPQTATLEQLAQLSVEEAASALMQMPPKEAMYLLMDMPDDRLFEVRRKIFDTNFTSYSDIMAEYTLLKLNTNVLREHEEKNNGRR